MKTRECNYPTCCPRNGNCPHSGNDELPVQCVGLWIRKKHYYLNRYLEATARVRKMFYKQGNAIYLDLFCGPGKCIIRNTTTLVETESGGVISYNISYSPFNEYYFIDIENENIRALQRRLVHRDNCYFITNDCNIAIMDIISKLLKQPDRLHFSYIDPFGVDNLKFNTLRELAKLNRNDMLINFPIGSIIRNIPKWSTMTNTPLDDFLGTPIWRERIRGVSGDHIYSILMDVFRNQLISVGFPEDGLESAQDTVPVKNTKEVELYVLFLAAKHPLAQKIWASTKKIGPDSQRKLF